MVCACARREGLAWEDAQDCAQECVVRLLERYPDLCPPISLHDLDAWLRAAARHDVADYDRHLASGRRHVLPPADSGQNGSGVSLLEAIPDPRDELELAFARAQFWEAIVPALDALDTRAHVCFIRRYLLHQAVTRIAAAEHLTPNHVSQLLRRARQRMARWHKRRGTTEADLRGLLSPSWEVSVNGRRW
jgi:RNA polymerase sigma factor (sigma-70 family)